MEMLPVNTGDKSKTQIENVIKNSIEQTQQAILLEDFDVIVILNAYV